MFDFDFMDIFEDDMGDVFEDDMSNINEVYEMETDEGMYGEEALLDDGAGNIDTSFDVDSDDLETLEDFDNDLEDFMVTENDSQGETLDNDDIGLEADVNIDSLFSEDSAVSSDDALAVPAYSSFDPAEATDVIGNPEEVMDNWHMQETSSSCAVASQEFALEQLTGQEFEEAELRDIAETNGWYDVNGGTSMDDVGNILEYYGLDVERSWGGTIDDIEHCLESGGQVIVGVDSEELWFGEDNDLFLPGMDADHAVQVIGIDHSDEANPMVILNDSGVGNGSGAQVPLDSFISAWEDSGNFMVAAHNSSTMFKAHQG